jgi:SAM-dependent methyltransferase
MTYKWNYLMTPEALPMFETICESIKKHKCKSVLDIGCGYSKISQLLDISICGIDLDEDAIDYCNENYPGEYLVQDGTTVNSSLFSNDFDCLVLSGLLYYFKDGFAGGITMTEYLNNLINEFNPKLIVVAEPQAREDYNGPDYTQFLKTFNPKSTPMSLDIRMGDRIVYEILV